MQNNHPSNKEHVNNEEESNYASMPIPEQGEYSLVDIDNEPHRTESIIVRVPTLFRCDDDAGTITDAGESIYNPNYSVRSTHEVNPNDDHLFRFIFD